VSFAGVVYVDVDDNNGKAKCDLCSFARKHPPPPYDDPAAHPPEQDRRWGVMHDCMDDVTLCKQDEEEQHAFHAGCLRAFILANKAKFRQPPVGCPVCDKTLEDLTRKAKKPAVGAAAGSGAKSEEKKGDGDDDDGLFGDDEDATALDEVGQTGGKKRKRDKQMYSVWVHVRQATGLALVGSDKTMNPVAYVSVFGKTVQTARGDGGKTYSCVWNESFSFSKLMDEDEFSREVIQIRVEDHAKIWRNTLIGFVKFQAETVRAQPNHEFYQLQYPIVNMAANRKTNPNAVTMQGQLEVSVCVLAEQDIKVRHNTTTATGQRRQGRAERVASCAALVFFADRLLFSSLCVCCACALFCFTSVAGRSHSSPSHLRCRSGDVGGIAEQS
jgi:hypothetical protein